MRPLLQNGWRNDTQGGAWVSRINGAYPGQAELVVGDFSHTAEMFALVVASGDEVSAASAFDYTTIVTNTHPSAVPLPPAVLLLGAPVAWIALGNAARRVRV